MASVERQSNETVEKIPVPVQMILAGYSAPMLNLHFFNPYLKQNSSHSYAGFQEKFQLLSNEEKNKFLEAATKEILELKKEILQQNNDKQVKKIMPFMHILVFLITYFLHQGKSSPSSKASCFL